MAEGDKPLTPDCNINRPLIKTAWEHIPIEMVRKSYLKCRISNKMDSDFEGF